MGLWEGAKLYVTVQSAIFSLFLLFLTSLKPGEPLVWTLRVFFWVIPLIKVCSSAFYFSLSVDAGGGAFYVQPGFFLTIILTSLNDSDYLQVTKCVWWGLDRILHLGLWYQISYFLRPGGGGVHLPIFSSKTRLVYCPAHHWALDCLLWHCRPPPPPRPVACQYFSQEWIRQRGSRFQMANNMMAASATLRGCSVLLAWISKAPFPVSPVSHLSS